MMDSRDAMTKALENRGTSPRLVRVHHLPSVATSTSLAAVSPSTEAFTDRDDERHSDVRVMDSVLCQSDVSAFGGLQVAVPSRRIIMGDPEPDPSKLSQWVCRGEFWAAPSEPRKNKPSCMSRLCRPPGLPRRCHIAVARPRVRP